jgi:hypothetical protein
MAHVSGPSKHKAHRLAIGHAWRIKKAEESPALSVSRQCSASVGAGDSTASMYAWQSIDIF